MDNCSRSLRFKALVLLWLFSLSTFAHAGYTSARPPPGWNPGNPPAYKPAPGEFYDLDKKAWMTMSTVNLGGRELTVPVKLPLGSAMTVGLAVASAFSSNPAILLGTLAWGLYQTYLNQKRITPNTDGTFEQVVDGISCESDCWEYRSVDGQWFPSLTQAAQASMNKKSLYQCNDPYSLYPSVLVSVALPVSYSFHYAYCGSGYVFPNTSTLTLTRRSIPPYNTSSIKIIPPSVVATEMGSAPLPYPPPEVLSTSGVPVPVGSPVLNPDAAGSPQTVRWPQGSPSPVPLPNPNTQNLPQTWKTPVIDLIPSPLPDDPWRLETVPKDITKTDPAPLPDPLNPNPDPTNPPVVPPPTEPGTTEETKDPDLCEKYPDILACAKPKLGSLEAKDIKAVDVPLAINPDTGWGPSGAACPAPKVVTVMGVTLTMPYTMLCNFASAINPLLIAFAWLSAAMSFFGMARKD